MNVPGKSQLRSAALEVVMAVIFEEIATGLGRRLRYGRRCNNCGEPIASRRPLRRLGAAVLTELAAEGGEEIYHQRRRIHAAVDHMVAQNEARTRAEHIQLPTQRGAAEPEQVRSDDLESTGAAWTPTRRSQTTV